MNYKKPKPFIVWIPAIEGQDLGKELYFKACLGAFTFQVFKLRQKKGTIKPKGSG